MANQYHVKTTTGSEEIHLADYHEVFNDWFLLYDKAVDPLKHSTGRPVAAFHRPQSVAIEILS